MSHKQLIHHNSLQLHGASCRLAKSAAWRTDPCPSSSCMHAIRRATAGAWSAYTLKYWSLTGHHECVHITESSPDRDLNQVYYSCCRAHGCCWGWWSASSDQSTGFWAKLDCKVLREETKKTVKLAQAHSLLLRKKKIEEEVEEEEEATKLLVGGPSTWDSSWKGRYLLCVDQSRGTLSQQFVRKKWVRNY